MEMVIKTLKTGQMLLIFSLDLCIRINDTNWFKLLRRKSWNSIYVIFIKFEMNLLYFIPCAGWANFFNNIIFMGDKLNLLLQSWQQSASHDKIGCVRECKPVRKNKCYWPCGPWSHELEEENKDNKCEELYLIMSAKENSWATSIWKTSFLFKCFLFPML